MTAALQAAVHQVERDQIKRLAHSCSLAVLPSDAKACARSVAIVLDGAAVYLGLVCCRFGVETF